MKAATQSGIMVDEIGWPLLVGGKPVSWEAIKALADEDSFDAHVQAVEKMGFSLFAKRARVGTSKHVRVRPRFDEWACTGTLTVLDDQITTGVLETILRHAGFYVGLCDWRPGSPGAPGQFGRFSVEVKEVK
jgi:hypothetical protein